MADTRPPLEVWQRGPVAGFEPLLMPVAHAFLQAQEDVRALADRIRPDQAWERPGGAASIAFHIRHLGRATDRLLTYARGGALDDAQRAALRAEATDEEPRPSLQSMIDEAVAHLERALEQVKETARESLLEERKLGRAGLPTTTLGLLFHAAEHATRHAGQAITTAKILAGPAQPNE
jgi:uncharacterized damage-inducible protein DinB